MFNAFSRKPSNVKRPPYHTSSSAGDMRVLSPATSRPSSPTPGINGIPDSLSFDNITQGGTCPPMTCRDFMHYLTYVEHSAENLQFYLWLLDYTARFKNLSPNDQVLSTEITSSAYTCTEIANYNNNNNNNNSSSSSSSSSVAGTRYSKVTTRPFADKSQHPNDLLSVPAPTKGNPFGTPPESPRSLKVLSYGFEKPSGCETIAQFLSDTSTLRDMDHAAVAADAFQTAGMNWQPFTIQPFREETTRIIAIYIAEGSPRELNVSARDRIAALRTLAQTTHPSAFGPLRRAVEDSLRLQAHPNFIRWSIRNGSTPRVVFAVGLGIVTIVAGFLIAVLLTLSGRARAWRALAAVAWVVGILVLTAASRGMCVILHGLRRRHVRPWELWDDDRENIEMRGDSNMPCECGSGYNSYEDEPWATKYAGVSIARKIFWREVWIEEPALRQMQNQIFHYSFLVAAVASTVLAVAFIALPKGGFM